jgi:hypothetical protein
VLEATAAAELACARRLHVLAGDWSRGYRGMRGWKVGVMTTSAKSASAKLLPIGAWNFLDRGTGTDANTEFHCDTALLQR